MAEFHPVHTAPKAPEPQAPKAAPKIAPSEAPTTETPHGQQKPEDFVPTPHGAQPGPPGTESEPKK